MRLFHGALERRVVVEPDRLRESRAHLREAALVRREPDRLLLLEIGARPQAADCRQVVRRDGGERERRILRGRLRLEPDDLVAEDRRLRETLADALFDGAEVLPDDERARAHALERDDAEQVVGAIAHERALCGREPVRHPEQAEEAHHVVDPQATRVTERRAHRLHERLVPGGGEPVRDEWRQPPVLAADDVAIGGTPDARARREDVLPHPRVGAVGIDADRQVLHERDLRTRGAELTIDQPLEPRVECHAIRVLVGEAAHAVGVGSAMLDRPRLPLASMLFSKRAEDCVLVQSGALRAVRVERRVAGESAPEPLQRTHLQREDAIAIDLALGVQRVAFFDERREPRPLVARAGDVFDADVQRIPEAPAARIVRARLLRHGDGRRGQWIEQDQLRPGGPRRPVREAAEVGEIANAPALARARRVELRGPAPDPKRLGQVTARGDDDDARRAAGGSKRVIAEWHVRRQRAIDRDGAAVFEREIAARADRGRRARAHDAHLRPGRSHLRIAAHRRDEHAMRGR